MVLLFSCCSSERMGIGAQYSEYWQQRKNNGSRRDLFLGWYVGSPPPEITHVRANLGLCDSLGECPDVTIAHSARGEHEAAGISWRSG